ncbi:MAG: amidophosphoribosyltransferase, partial [Candidatus Cloacimonadota bacterium]
GILGIYGYEDISDDLVFGLTALQHRGQDSAGILTFDNNFHLRKGLGLVSSVFTQKKQLTGYCGIGQVRYATQGTIDLLNAQPFVVNYPLGLGMVHNGNVINFAEIKKLLYEEHHRLLETSNDIELILYTFASELESKNLMNLSLNDIFSSVEATQRKIKGAYSTISIIANKGFLVFNDPYGIRPLVMGQKKTSKGIVYAFASESTCLDYLEYELLQDLKPGEAIFIDKDRNVHKKICYSKGAAFCVFEYIYFAKEDSIIHNRLVATERVKMGKLLAKNIKMSGFKPDIVIDIPSSAYFFASGLAEELGISYRRGLAKNNHIGRSFISPTKKTREVMVQQKLNPIRDIIKGKKIAVVDDSIVRGITSKYIVNLLRQRGAKEIYFISASPPIKYPCVYGIDMSVKQELIARNYDLDDIADYIGADALIYQSIDDIKSLYHDLPCCYACFSGDYPIEKTKEFLGQIEQERLCSKHTNRNM